MPGGCATGARPIDLHLKGFRALGAEVEENDEEFYVEAAAKNGLVGDALYLDFPSVGATQNIIMAATLAKGETVIENAAREPATHCPGRRRCSSRPSQSADSGKATQAACWERHRSSRTGGPTPPDRPDR